MSIYNRIFPIPGQTCWTLYQTLSSTAPEIDINGNGKETSTSPRRYLSGTKHLAQPLAKYLEPRNLHLLEIYESTILCKKTTWPDQIQRLCLVKRTTFFTIPKTQVVCVKIITFPVQAGDPKGRGQLLLGWRMKTWEVCKGQLVCQCN